MSPFDSVRTTTYSTLIETMLPSCIVFEIYKTTFALIAFHVYGSPAIKRPNVSEINVCYTSTEASYANRSMTVVVGFHCDIISCELTR